MALAVYVNYMPMIQGDTSLASAHFAWDIVIDDQPSVAPGSIGSGFGTGQDAFLSAGSTQFLLADNASFQNPTSLANNNTSLGVSYGGGPRTSIGTPSTFMVSSGTFQSGQFASLGGGSITRTGPGVYRYDLPTPFAHSVSGRVNSSAGNFDFGTFWTPMNASRRVGVQNVTTPTGTTYLAPNYSASGATNTVYYFSDTFTNQSYLEFHFFATATGNPPSDVAGLSLTLDRYLATEITNTLPQSFTVAQGQDVLDRLYVDFAVPGSTVNINSPVSSSTDAADPGFIDRAPAVGFELLASTININQSLTASSPQNWMTLGRISGFSSLYNDFFFTAPATTAINVNAVVGANDYYVGMEGSPTVRGAMSIGTQGAVVGAAGIASTANSTTFDVRYTDLQFLGDVRAAAQNYLITANGSAEQYSFTTRDPASGAHAGSIIGTTLAMTLSSPQGGSVDLATDVSTLRFSGGAATDVPYDYSISIDNATTARDLTVDAVAASTGPISLSAGGNLKVTGAAIRTVGDITLRSTKSVTVGSIGTGNGIVTLVAPSLSLTGAVMSGGMQAATLEATTGVVAAGALVRAGGVMRQSVRLASEQNYPLGGLVAGLSFGGGTLAAGDRILLKNQTVSTQNGIYVVPALGAASRATDANTSASFVSGMNVLVREGSQEGQWTFQNAAATVLGTTGLNFVPTTATRVYGSVSAASGYVLGVDVATSPATGDISNLTTSGPPASLTRIDGVLLTAGMRVLVQNQTNPNENGIYVVPVGVNQVPWTRASDADSPVELAAGGYVYVARGTQQFQSFALAEDVPLVGSSPVRFVPFTVQTTRQDTWSPINVLDDVAVATTATIDLTSTSQPTIDGVLLQNGQRVLVKNQIDATQNGVWIFNNGWTRAPDVPLAGTLARTSSVCVLYGTQNAGTAWQFNDASLFRGTITAGSPLITGVIANSALAVNMLVTAPGIPSGTTIQQINTDGSIRLSASATTSATEAFSLLSISPVTVGADPLVFIPAGGDIDVTAATDIGGSGRLQSASILLTAGAQGPTTSKIDTLLNVGRVTATSPGSIKLRNSAPLELDLVQSTSAGFVDVSSTGTLTALSVTAAAGATAQPVTLSSTGGDVVVESVQASRGDITVTSSTGRIAFTKARRFTPTVTALSGSIQATADTANATEPAILVDGQLAARGGSIVFASNLGKLQFNATAVVSADDQLRINTPNQVVQIVTGASFAAARLGLTAQFGAATSPDPRLGTYQTVSLNRTDVGNLDFTALSDVTIEGATTSGGSIIFTAPKVTVTGTIASQGASTDVTLIASAGDVAIDAAVKSQRDVILQAPAGEIGGTRTQAATATVTAGSAVIRNLASTSGLAVGARVAGVGIPAISAALPAGTCIVSIDSATQVTLSAPATSSGSGVSLTFTAPTGLLTAPRNVSATASSAARLAVSAAGLASTSLSANNAMLGVTDTDGLDLISVSMASGGVTAFNIGSSSSAGIANVGLVDAGVTGSIYLSSYGNILGISSDTTADIRAATATLRSTAGRIRLDTDVDVLTATVVQKNQSLTINDIGSVQLLSVGSGSSTVGVDVDVTAAGTITATNVLTAGKVTLKATGPSADADILIDSIVAAGNVVSLQADNSIGEVSPGDATADITATRVLMTASNGDINVYLAASAAAAQTSAAGKSVTIQNDTALSLGASSTTTMNLKIGGVVSQTGAINATTLKVNAFNGSDITLTQANTVKEFAASSLSGATRGNITFNDADTDLALGSTTDGLVGGTVKISAVGNVSQTVPFSAANAIDATSLRISTTAGSSISLDNPDNKIGGLQSANGGVLTVSSSSGFVASGLSGTIVTINAKGDVTQLAGAANAITATMSLTVVNTAGIVNLNNPANSTLALAIDNGSRAVTYVNAGVLDIAAAGIKGGPVALTAGGTLTQTGTIAGTSLDITSNAGNVALNAANDVDSLAIRLVGTTTGRTIAFSDVDDLSIGVGANGITGGAVTLDVGGSLSQTRAIAGTTLDMTSAGGNVTLNAANDVDSLAVRLSGTTTGRTIAFTDADDLSIGVGANGITGGAVTLVVGGALTQTSVVLGTSLDITSNAGNVTLNAMNDVDSLAIKLAGTTTGRTIAFSDVDDLSIGIGANGITGGSVNLAVGGNLDQTQAISGTSLGITLGAGAATLNQANSIGTFTATSNSGDIPGTGSISFTNAGTFNAGPITAGGVLAGTGSISLTANSGNLQIVGSLTALKDSVSLNAPAGTITFATTTPPVSINADILSYSYDRTKPAPVLPGTVPPIIVTNGDLTLTNPDPTNTVLVNGYTVSGNITITSNAGFTVSGPLTAGAGKAVSLTAFAGSIGFAGAGGIFYTTTNGTTTLSATAGTITDTPTTVISGAATTVSVGQNLSQQGRINSGKLTVTASNAASVSLVGANSVDQFTASSVNGGSRGAVTLNDTTTGLVLGALSGGTVTITGLGVITQSGAIDATALDITGDGSAIALNTQNNTIGGFRVANSGGSVSLRDTSAGLDLGAVTGGVVTINGVGAITQSGVISAATLDITGTGSAISLDTQNNTIGLFKAANAGGNVSLRDASAGLDLGAITGGVVTINGVGAITQSGAINASTLDVTGDGSAITLNTRNNTIGSFKATNASGSISLKDTNSGLDIGTVTGGLVTIDGVGAFTQSGVIDAATLAITGTGGTIALDTQNNTIGVFTVTNNAGAVSVRDTAGGLSLGNITSGTLTVTASNTGGAGVTVNQTRVVSSGNIAIFTDGGLTIVGSEPPSNPATGVLTATASNSVIDLRNVAGAISLVRGGQIVAPTVLGNGQNIQVGGIVTTAAALGLAMSTANSLSPISGSSYEILVGDNITITSGLVASRAITLRGNNDVAYTISNGGTVATGLTITGAASGTTVRNLAFSGFPTNGILVNGGTSAKPNKVSLSNLTIKNSGNIGAGLNFAGSGNSTFFTGSTVQNCTFDGNPFAIRLTSANGVTVGGTAANQINRVNGSSKAGIFASGFCTNSAVIKTVFTNTTTPYSTSTSRNLRIVR